MTPPPEKTMDDVQGRGTTPRAGDSGGGVSGGVLCFDLGTALGWAYLSGAGHIVERGAWQMPGPEWPSGVRFKEFRTFVRHMIRTHQPNAIVFEQPFGRYKNVLQIQFGQMAVLEVACEDHSLEYSSVRPQEIKKHATGKGNASKAAMAEEYERRGAEIIEGYDPDISEDTIDAIWLADYVREEMLA